MVRDLEVWWRRYRAIAAALDCPPERVSLARQASSRKRKASRRSATREWWPDACALIIGRAQGQRQFAMEVRRPHRLVGGGIRGGLAEAELADRSTRQYAVARSRASRRARNCGPRLGARACRSGVAAQHRRACRPRLDAAT